MPREHSGVERKYWEKARRDRKEIEYIHIKMLCEWIKYKHPHIFTQFSAIYYHISGQNPTTKNIWKTADWKNQLFNLNQTTTPIQQEMEKEVSCLHKVFPPLLTPSLPILTTMN